MAEFLDGALRVNSVVEALSALRAVAKARVSSIPVRSGYTTTPDGRVLDPVGNIVYTPTPIKPEAGK